MVRGMNGKKDVAARREATQLLYEHEVKELFEGKNPATGAESSTDPLAAGALDENAPLLAALQWAYENCGVDPVNTLPDIRSMMNYIPIAVNALGYGSLPIGMVKKRQVRHILDQCARIKFRIDPRSGKKINVSWSNDKFNKYRSYLMILFGELIEIEAMDMNPCLNLKKRKTVKKIRETPTQEQLQIIDKFLHDYYYTFWRFMHLFFHSGARVSEFMQLKVKDIRLDPNVQKFKRLIKKERTYVEKLTTIKDIARDLWAEQIEGAKPEDYVFSRGLVPGADPIRDDQINKRWLRLVKKRFGVTADFYSLKHLNSTQTKKRAGSAAAAEQNGHRTTDMVDTRYDVDREVNMHETLKGINNPLVGSNAHGLRAGSNCTTITLNGPLLPPPPPRICCKPCLIGSLEPLQYFTRSVAA